jgi:hypothetical protein
MPVHGIVRSAKLADYTTARWCCVERELLQTSMSRGRRGLVFFLVYLTVPGKLEVK